jgi:L-ribulose-5-phosphate 4-epimerase
MKLKSLREEVCQANIELSKQGVVLYSFGNASGIDREQGIVAIKPSGILYEDLKPENIVLVDLENKVVEGNLRPSSDTKTHTLLYREWDTIGGICHTHSTYATAWAQARRPIPCLGTTHADYLHGDVPCTSTMSKEQVSLDYEDETGKQIVTEFKNKDPRALPMVLVAGHGPFTWGDNVKSAVHHAVVLEKLAHMAYLSSTLSEGNPAILEQHILEKHYNRKHGPNAYYGQKSLD